MSTDRGAGSESLRGSEGKGPLEVSRPALLKAGHIHLHRANMKGAMGFPPTELIRQHNSYFPRIVLLITSREEFKKANSARKSISLLNTSELLFLSVL